jgi:hypothetical protein
MEGLVLGEVLDEVFELVEVAVVGEADLVGQLGEDLHPLDGVDGQVGLDVEVGVEHVGRVARPGRHDLDQPPEQPIGVGQHGCGPRAADPGRVTGRDDQRTCVRRGPVGQAVGVADEEADDGAEGLVLGEVLDEVFELVEVAVVGEADLVGQLGEDLHPLDGVDGQVGLDVEVGVEHVGGVTRAGRHDAHQPRQQGVGVRQQRRCPGQPAGHGRRRHGRHPVPVAVGGGEADATGPRRHDRRRGPAGQGGEHCRVDRRVTGAQGRCRRHGSTEVAEDHLPAGLDEVVRRLQVLQDDVVGGGQLDRVGSVAEGRRACRRGRAHGDVRGLGGRLHPAGDGLAVPGLADAVAVDRPHRPLGGVGPAPGVAVAAGVEGVEVDGHAGDGELGDGLQEGGDAVPAGPVGGHGQVGLARERAGDEAGEHPAGPHLHEHPYPGGVHRPDLVREPHALRHLPGDQRPGALGSVGVHLGRRVGPHRDDRRPELDTVQVARQAVGGPGHDRAVEGAGDGDALGGDPVVLELADGVVDGRRRPGDHDLLGVVVVGDHDPGVAEHGLDLVT